MLIRSHHGVLLVLLWAWEQASWAAASQQGRAKESLVLPTCARPHVIAHRGASGYLPEHTLQAYRLAIDLGVDYIEPDLVLTKDGHLICRHDVDLTETTDVASRPEFRDRRRNVTFDSVHPGPDGKPLKVTSAGYFSFDFTLAEIKQMRAKQRLSQRSSTYDGLFEIPTFEEVVKTVREAEVAIGKPVGIYAEIKEPYFFKLQGFDIESTLVGALRAQGLVGAGAKPSTADGPHPIVIQCFDPASLQSLSSRIPSVPLVQLLQAPRGAEFPDTMAQHLGRDASFGDAPLREVAVYASGIGPQKDVLTSAVPEAARAIVDEAHALGLAVHPWTFRREESFVDRAFREDPEHELRFFYECLNVDALFVEFPDQANAVIQQILLDDSDAEARGRMIDEALRGNLTAQARVSLASPLSLVDPAMQGHREEEEARRSCLQLRKARSCTLVPVARAAPRWLRRSKVPA